MGNVPRWTPSVELTKHEERVLARLGRVRKLLGFLRRRRHELFDESFQVELESMYRLTGAGKDPIAPAQMAMGMLVQGYLGVSDAEFVELTVMDLRVQLVLGCFGVEEPPFAQGTYQQFRDRMIENDMANDAMDIRLLERTVELAKRTKELDPRNVPKSLRVAMDSSPLQGAGRVEDTINLLGHAGRKVAECAAELLKWSVARLCKEAGAPLLMASSVKAGLDIDWNDAAQKADAINIVIGEIDSLKRFLERRLPEELTRPPLEEHVETLDRIRTQDLEPDPNGGGVRIREGVAPDRRISVEDREMRHGRKSKAKTFNGYKRHIAADIDDGTILACAVLPANRPEEEAAPMLQADIAKQGWAISELHIDRGYINSTSVDDVLAARGEVVSKPWHAPNGGLFEKADFKLNMRDRTLTCPVGQTETIQLGASVEFDPEICDHCPLRADCTTAEPGHGRTVAISENEMLQHRLRKLQKTSSGRERLRQRTQIEHQLAHISQRQGNRARYKGARKNTFDVRRASCIQNLEGIDRREREEVLAKAA